MSAAASHVPFRYLASLLLCVQCIGMAQAMQPFQLGETTDSLNFARLNYNGTLAVSGCDDGVVRILDTKTGKIVRQIKAHSDWVMLVDFSPDGSRVASCSHDGMAMVIDAANGATTPLVGHTDQVHTIYWSPDGTKVVTASGDGRAIIWDALTGVTLHNLSLPANVSGTRVARFNPAGTLVAVGDDDGYVAVYSAATGDPVWVQWAHSNRVPGIVWSPDGGHVATCSNDRTGKILAADDGSVVRILDGHTDRLTWVDWSPDGKYIATSSADDTARVFEVGKKSACTFRSAQFTMYWVEFSPSSLWVVSGSSDYTARIFDAATCTELQVLSAHSWTVVSAQFSPDGNQLLTAGWDGITFLFDVTQLTLIRPFAQNQEIAYAAFSPNGSLAVLAPASGPAWLSPTTERVSPVTILDGSDAIFLAAFTPDSLTVVTAGLNGDISSFDSTTGQRIKVLFSYGSVSLLELSPNGQFALVATDSEVSVLEVATGVQRFVIQHPPYLRTITWHPTGKHFATGTDDEHVRIYDTATGTIVSNFSHGNIDGTHFLKYSPDGKQLVVIVYYELFGRVYDPATGIEIFKLEGHTSDIQAMAYSPDGNWIATSSWDATARVYNSSTGKGKGLTGHLEGILGVHFSPDSNYLITSCPDKTSRIYSVHTAKMLVTFPHSKSVTGALFSPDGQNVLTYTESGAFFWCGLRCAAIIDVFECERIGFHQYHCPQRAQMLLLLEGTAPPPLRWAHAEAPDSPVDPLRAPNCSLTSVVVTHTSVVQCNMVIPEGISNKSLWVPMHTTPQVYFSFEYTPYCSPWEYSHPTRRGECLPCRSSYNCSNCDTQDAMQCNGGPTRRLNEGFWRCNAQSEYVYQCPSGRQCLGDEGCAPGSYGVLCASCSRKDGYVRWGKSCSRCWSPTPAVLLFAAIAIVGIGIFFAFINTQTSRPSDEDVGEGEAAIALLKKRQHLQLALKQLLHFLQASSTLGGLHVPMSNVVAQVISVQSVVSGGGLLSVPLLGCYTEYTVITRVQGVAFGLPLGLVVMAVALDVYKHRQSKFVSFRSRTDFMTRASGDDPSSRRSFWIWQYLAVFLCMLTFMATFAVRTFLQPFHKLELNCGEAGTAGVLRYHQTDMDLPWDDPGLASARALCVILLLIWVVGLPVLGYAAVRAASRHLGKETSSKLFIFLLQGYQPNRWWWELVQLARKLLLTAVVELVEDPNWQAELCQILLVSYMLAVLLLSPYISAYHNRLEGMTTGLLSVTLALVIQYGRTTHSENWGLVLSGGILAVQIVAMVVLLWRISTTFTASSIYLQAKGVWEARSPLRKSQSEPCNSKEMQQRLLNTVEDGEL